VQLPSFILGLPRAQGQVEVLILDTFSWRLAASASAQFHCMLNTGSLHVDYEFF